MRSPAVPDRCTLLVPTPRTRVAEWERSCAERPTELGVKAGGDVVDHYDRPGTGPGRTISRTAGNGPAATPRESFRPHCTGHRRRRHPRPARAPRRPEPVDPPFVDALSLVLGGGTLVAVAVRFARPVRAATWVAVVLRVLSALGAIPAFLGGDLPPGSRSRWSCSRPDDRGPWSSSAGPAAGRAPQPVSDRHSARPLRSSPAAPAGPLAQWAELRTFNP
jgi:hypothetical protein